MKQFGLIASAILACLIGCGQQQKVNPQAIGYGVELLQCVDKAKSKAESQECRKLVDAKYGQCDGGCQ
jgi:hypothetical protein